MSALTDFLTARLDEDEATAKAAVHAAFRQWCVEPWYDGRFLDDRRTARADVWGDTGYPVTATGAVDTLTADHIARNDPARALREVDAKRKILAEYQRLDAEISDLVVRGRQPGHHMDAMRALHVAVCAFAAVWSDHPDYVKLKKES